MINAQSLNGTIEQKVPGLRFDELRVKDPVIRTIYHYFGLENKLQIRNLTILIVGSLLILSLATMIEDRFYYRSLSTVIIGYGNLLGMSFLGDTMVWPYTILLPICLLLAKVAFRRSVKLVNQISELAGNAWAKDSTILGYEAALSQARAILTWDNGFLTKLIRSITWGAAIVFWVYNSLTCGLHPWIPDRAYPYRTERAIILPSPSIPTTKLPPGTKLPSVIQFDEAVPIAKWDCDPQQAPISCVVARVWSLAFYGITPFLLAHLLTSIWGVSSFLLKIRRWEASRNGDVDHIALRVEPFGKDTFGGLHLIADVGMSYLYGISAFSMLVAMAFIKEGVTPSWHNYALLLLFIPIALISFFLPTTILRRSILVAKESFLFNVSFELNTLSAQIRHCSKVKTAINENQESMYYRLSSLKMLYDQAHRISEWPFTFSVFFKILLAIGTPVLTVLVEKIALKLTGL